MSADNTINAQITDDASIMPNISNKKILVGYWHNWPAGIRDGYQSGNSVAMNLTDIPLHYVTYRRDG